MLCASVRVGSFSAAGGGVWERVYELGEGTNVALANRAAAEMEGSTIAAMDALSFFLLFRRDFGRSALACNMSMIGRPKALVPAEGSPEMHTTC